MAVIHQIDEETRTAYGLFADLPVTLDAPWRVGDRYVATDTEGLYTLLRDTLGGRAWVSAAIQNSATPITLSSADRSGTPGNCTINKSSGRVAFTGGTHAVTVTNNLVTASSHVIAQMSSVDATLTDVLNVVPGAGSFVINGNVNATGTPTADFIVFTAGT